MESNISAPVLLNLLNSLRKIDKMLDKHRMLSLFLNSFNKFNKNMSTHIRSSIYLQIFNDILSEVTSLRFAN